ncbi:MAG: zinc-ribbon domain-containing protein [Deltaproteobacteria bacterium]|nr:zinc-ribbon domain-containing protein [Deltaproteobacteria bacterium]
MNFICDKCTTRYSIPDEKVAGKILKLRCKKCGNTIVLKDPKATSELSRVAKTDEGHVLLQNAFKQSLSKQLSTTERSGITDDIDTSSNADKTQIARIPGFNESVPHEEEWYLADSRGQAGPMTLSELIARIKRGEPDPEAVVWKDGFRDWLTIDMVPELRMYHKHSPPPRRPTRELSRQDDIEQVSVSTGPYIAQKPVRAPINITTSREFNQSNVPSQIVIPSEALSPFRNKLIPIISIAAVVSILAFFLGGKLMGSGSSSSNSSQTQKNQVQNQQAVPPPQMKVVEAKPPQMNEVVYIVANEPSEQDSKGDSSESKNGKTVKNHSMLNNRKVVNHKNTMAETADSGSVSAPANSRGSGVLRTFMRSNQGVITRCYARTVRMGQKDLVDQSIKIHLKVASDGKLLSVSFSGRMPPIMKNCMISTISSLKYPKGTQTDRLTYAIHFN